MPASIKAEGSSGNRLWIEFCSSEDSALGQLVDLGSGRASVRPAEKEDMHIAENAGQVVDEFRGSARNKPVQTKLPSGHLFRARGFYLATHELRRFI